MTVIRCAIWLLLLMCVVLHMSGYDHGDRIAQREPADRGKTSLPEKQAHRIGHSREERRLLLFVIDLDDFMCMSCLDAFLAFCRSFPPRFLEEEAWGILVLPEKHDSADRNISARIAEKKMRGFTVANGIEFPILIDRYHMFDACAAEGTAAIVFDDAEKWIRRYSFPVKREDVRKIHEVLLKN